MDKKRSKTSNFSLDIPATSGQLPSKDDIEKTIAKATGQEPSAKENKKNRRLPLTTAISPENRANLEAAAHAGNGSVADIINKALEYYFLQVEPISNIDIRDMFLKLYQSK